MDSQLYEMLIAAGFTASEAKAEATLDADAAQCRADAAGERETAEWFVD